MPWVGFKPTIPAFERAETVHALDRAATVIGWEDYLVYSDIYISIGNILLFCTSSRAALPPPPSFLSNEYGGVLSPEVKRQGREADFSPSHPTAVECECSIVRSTLEDIKYFLRSYLARIPSSSHQKINFQLYFQYWSTSCHSKLSRRLRCVLSLMGQTLG
jgi:hypothetical protein